MTEIVDIKTRRKTKAPVDEPETTLADFFKELTSVDNLSETRGAIVITWTEDGDPAFSHYNATWAEILWHAYGLARYATSDEEEDDADD